MPSATRKRSNSANSFKTAFSEDPNNREINLNNIVGIRNNRNNSNARYAKFRRNMLASHERRTRALADLYLPRYSPNNYRNNYRNNSRRVSRKVKAARRRAEESMRANGPFALRHF
jgi:hypothetical protein